MIRVGKTKSGFNLQTAVFLLLILWLAFGLRLLYLRQVSPFVDEYISMLAIQSIIEHGTPILPSGFMYGPKALLHSYLGALAVWLYGSSEFASRFPSLLAGVLAVSVVYRAGRDWFSSAVGLSAAMALAWLPAAVQWGGRARMYSLFQLLALVGVYLLINGYLAGSDRRARLLGIALMLLAIYAHTLALIVLAGLIVGLITTRLIWSSKPSPTLVPSRWELSAGLIFFGAVFLLNPMAGPWGAAVRLSETAHGALDLQDRFLYLVAFTHQFVVWPLWPLTIFYAVGFVSLFTRLVKKSSLSGDRVAFCLYILVLCVWLLTSILSKLHDDRYLFGILPFFLLLALREVYLISRAIFLSVKQSALPGGTFGLVSLMSVVVIALFAPSTLYLLGQDNYGFAPAYAYARDNWQNGDVVATCSPAPSYLVLSRTDYYVIQYGAETRNGVDIWTGAPLVDTPQGFADILDNNSRVWFVIEKACWERHFDASFEEVVYEKMRVAFDQKGMLVFVSNSG